MACRDDNWHSNYPRSLMENVLTVFYKPIIKNRTHRPLIIADLFAMVEVRVRTPRRTVTFPKARSTTTKIGEVLRLPIESLVMQIYSGST